MKRKELNKDIILNYIERLHDLNNINYNYCWF